MSFRPNSHQHAIFDFVRAGDGDGVVRATAGSGKTTTLKHVTSLLPDHLRVCFLAFNKNICEELSRKLPSTVEIQTIHRLGKRAIDDYTKAKQLDTDVDPKKLKRLIQRWLPQLSGSLASVEQKDAETFMHKLFTLARFNCVDLKDERSLRDVSLKYNLKPPTDPRIENQILGGVPEVHANFIREFHDTGTIDFDDMVSLPRELGITPQQYDLSLIHI